MMIAVDQIAKTKKEEEERNGKGIYCKGIWGYKRQNITIFFMIKCRLRILRNILKVSQCLFFRLLPKSEMRTRGNKLPEFSLHFKMRRSKREPVASSAKKANDKQCELLSSTGLIKWISIRRGQKLLFHLFHLNSSLHVMLSFETI